MTQTAAGPLHKLLQLLAYGLLALVVFLFLLVLTVQIPVIQDWGVKWISKKISEDLQTTVQIDQFSINFFDDLTLKNFLILDQKGDTILFSRHFYLNFKNPVIGIFNRVFEIEDIASSDGSVKLFRSEEGLANYQFLVDYFSAKADKLKLDNDLNKRQFKLIFSPSHFQFKNLTFENIDLQKGQIMKGRLDRSSALITSIDNALVVETVELNSPVLKLEKWFAGNSSNLSSNLQSDSEYPYQKDLSVTQEEPVPTANHERTIIKELIIKNGSFSHTHRDKKRTAFADDLIDFNDIQVEDINILLKDFVVLDSVWHGDIRRVNFITSQGFILQDFSSSQFIFSDQMIAFNQLNLQTPSSHLQDTLILHFRDIQQFDDFPNEITLTGIFKDSYIAFNDLMFFFKGLNNNEFFTLNRLEKIEFEGRFTGKINNLRGTNVHLAIAEKGFLNGNFSLRNVTTKGEELLNLDLTNAEVDMYTLRQLIPGFEPPRNFNKLGMLRFSGRFDGFFQDFVAYGNLSTSLGSLQTDMRLNLKNGKNQANYSGEINLIDFDLRKWTGSDQYGLATFSAQISEGSGLTLDSVQANLNATLVNFDYNNYNYKNVHLTGELNRNLFDGELKIDDENIKLDFKGTIELRDSLPHFDFVAAVERIDFYKLNLSEGPFSASGEIAINSTFYDPLNLNGEITGYSLRLDINGQIYSLDSVSIISEIFDDRKRLEIISDVADINIEGTYDIRSIPFYVRDALHQNHPGVYHKLNIVENESVRVPTSNNFIYECTIKNSKSFQRLIFGDIPDILDCHIKGYFSSSGHELNYKFDLASPGIQFFDHQLEELHIRVENDQSSSVIEITADNWDINNQSITPFRFKGKLDGDSLFFDISTEKISHLFTDVSLSGKLQFHSTLYQMEFKESRFVFLNDPWIILPDNSLRFSEQYLKTENLVFLSDMSSLKVQSPGDGSVMFSVSEIDISFLDEFLNFFDFNFTGSLSSTIFINNLFSDDLVDLNIRVEDLNINGDDFGTLRSRVYWKNILQPGNLDFSIARNQQRFLANGNFFIPVKKAQKEKPIDLNLYIDIEDFPMKIAEYFIGNAISQTTGVLNADISILSENNKPAIYGEARLNGSTRLDYLGTTYYMENQRIKLSPTFFDASEGKLKDELGNVAEIRGGFTHNYFKKFGLAASINASQFLFLNTTKNDNNVYYGRGLGKATVQFGGDFKQTEIGIQAVTGPSSKIFIPINYGYDASEVSFIEIVSAFDTTTVKSGDVFEIRGINMNMDLTITPDAEFQIIFNEQAGDIIKGRGSGNFSLLFERSGSFEMYGNYTIESGEYLYTLLDFINKPFLIERGGRISWNGEPLDAVLDIRARYTGLKTPPRNFIAEYLENNVDGQLNDLAGRPTRVDLLMHLTGLLSQPEIVFDLQFPDLDPSVRNLTDSKMRVLKEDESELNRQIGALLITNTFLPPSYGLDLTVTTVNTLSELVTSQLSNYISAWLEQSIENVDYVSGVDLYIDYNYYRTDDFIRGDQTGIKTGSEFAFVPNIRFFDDRLEFSPGASVIDGTAIQNSTFIGTDIELEYALTEDKRLKIRLYNRSIPSLEGRRIKTGVGVSFRKSFDSIWDIFKKRKTEQESLDEEKEKISRVDSGG